MRKKPKIIYRFKLHSLSHIEYLGFKLPNARSIFLKQLEKLGFMIISTSWDSSVYVSPMCIFVDTVVYPALYRHKKVFESDYCHTCLPAIIEDVLKGNYDEDT